MISGNNISGIELDGNGAGISGSAALWLRGENDFTDELGNNNGTDVGGVTFAPGVGGGQAFQLNGTNQHVEIPDAVVLDATTQLTVEAWINPTALSGGSSQFYTIATKYNSQDNGISWGFWAKNNGQLDFRVSSDGTTTNTRIILTTNASIPLGQFSHVAATFDADTQEARIYLNGVELQTVVSQNINVSSIANTSTPVRIGAFENVSGVILGHFNGLIDEPAIYNSTLTADQINGIFRLNGAGKQGSVITSNIIGLNADGNAEVPNGSHGVWLNSSASGTTIGGFTPTPGTGLGNVISGNGGSGIEVEASHTTILGNLIGTSGDGLDEFGNEYGIQVTGGENIQIGGDDDDDSTLDGVNRARNIISGNLAGVQFHGVDPTGIVLQGNFIGTDINGDEELPNINGVNVINSYDVTIGGTTAMAGNVISGNSASGLSILQSNLEGQTSLVQGNIIGMTADGLSPLGNGGRGIAVATGLAGSVTIGGSVAGAGNVISDNAQEGIVFESGNDGHTVLGNYIGTDITGSGMFGNGFNGIRIVSSDRITIGGSTELERNIISNNTGHGITISGSNGNTISGNFIGTDINGTADLGNTGRGISTTNASNNTIGGVTDGHRNVIIGNGDVGITLSTGSNDNVVIGNYISVDDSGDNLVANGWSISIANSARNRIGGGAMGEGNIIGQAVIITGSNQANTTRNKVQGNYIGIGESGNSLGYAGSGVVLEYQAFENFVGTDSDGSNDETEGNVISGLGGAGVVIRFAGTDENVVAGNRIGTSTDGLSAVGNNIGVVLQAGPSNNVIGGSTEDELNLISGNTTDGILITGSGTDSNTVSGNHIGLDSGGLDALDDSDVQDPLRNGITIEDGARLNLIGGDTDGERNVISGNRANGIRINTSASFNTISGNYIGTDKTGQSAVPNLINGVEIANSAAENIIGGFSDEERNVISGNLRGVSILASGTGNKIRGNYIGTDKDGEDFIRNQVGISVNGPGTIIGGGQIGAGNLLSGNQFYGIEVTSASATDTIIQGNLIGTDWTGNVQLANLGGGIIVTAGTATIGVVGDLSNDNREGNVIAGNGAFGIELRATGTTVAGNRIGVLMNDSALTNTGHQVLVKGDTNIIGTDGDGTADIAERNFIVGAGTGVASVYLDTTANFNRVSGNYIGTKDGINPLGGFLGVEVRGDDNFIGTDGDGSPGDAKEGNLISGHDDDNENSAGILVEDADAHQNRRELNRHQRCWHRRDGQQSLRRLDCSTQ